MRSMILLICSMTVNLIGTVTKKHIINKTQDAVLVGHIYNLLASLTAAIALLCMNGFSLPSLFTVVLAVVFGVITALQQVSNIQALKLGPLSYTSVIGSLSTMIPTLCGAIIWGETIAVIQWVGILLMVGCFLLSVSSDAEQKKTSARWLIYCAILFVCTGGIGVMQKWHQSTVYKDELDAFLLIAFAFSTVYSAALLVHHLKSQEHGNVRAVCTQAGIRTWVLILIVVGGICAALNNKWNLYLSGVMDSAVFFPVVNGGGLILTTLSAVVLFRERLRTKQWIGMLIGTAAVICLCNPFA